MQRSDTPVLSISVTLLLSGTVALFKDIVTIIGYLVSVPVIWELFVFSVEKIETEYSDIFFHG